MEYKASMDNLAYIITIGVVGLGVYMFLGSKIIVSLILMMVVLLAFLWSPRRYYVNEIELVIVRFIGKVSIPLDSIAEIETPNKELTKGVVRTFGVGGLFGYFGKFYNSRLGQMDFYVTQRKNYVLIKLYSGKKIMLSPNDIGLGEEISRRKGSVGEGSRVDRGCPECGVAP